jgi:MFS family permease
VASTPVPAGMALRGNRDFRLLWTGGLLANLGSQMSALALPLLVLAKTGSPVWAGAVGSASAATTLVTLIPGGAVADAVERRRLMITCELAAAAIAAALAAAATLGHVPVAFVLPVAVLIAALGSVYAPAASALLRAAVPGDSVGSALSYLQARSAAARLGGPLLGGLLFGISPALPFAVQGAGLLVSSGCLLAMGIRATPARRGASPLTPRLLFAGLLFLWQRPFLRAALIIAGAGLNAVFGAVLLAAVATAARHDPSGRSSGLVVACAGAGGLAGSLLAARWRAQQRPRAAILLACWTCAAAVSAMGLAASGWIVALLIGGCTFTTAIANVAFSANMLVLSPGDLVGRVQAAAGFISMIVSPAGPLAGGVLLASIGARASFTVLGAVLAGFAVVASLSGGLRQHPHQRSGADAGQ